MLPYFGAFRNAFPTSLTPAWPWGGVVWGTRGLAGLAPLRHALQAACLTRARLSTPCGHLSRTDSRMPCAAASRWRPPPAVSLRDHPATTPTHPPHALAMAATGHGASPHGAPCPVGGVWTMQRTLTPCQSRRGMRDTRPTHVRGGCAREGRCNRDPVPRGVQTRGGRHAWTSRWSYACDMGGGR